MPGKGTDIPSKRSAPISASAFSFSLNTPEAKKPRPISTATPLSSNLSFQHVGQTPTRVKAEPSTPTSLSRLMQDRACESTIPLREHAAIKEEEDLKPVIIPPSQATATPRRLVSVFQPLNNLHTPLNRQNRLGDPGPSTSKALRRINDGFSQITPRPEVDGEIDQKPRIALNDVRPSERLPEDLFAKKRSTLLDENEGVGVSPRGKRSMKWTGQGAPPPSVQLANLLSSANSSLHLFYTSTQHILYPSHRPTLTPARSNQTKARGSASALKHIENSALLRLRILSHVPGSTHHPTLFWCEALKWSFSETPPGRVLVIFQPVPSECPRMGLDPRLLAVRGNDRMGRKWQVGLWSWSEVEIPSIMTEAKHDGQEEAQRDESIKCSRALLATRYLIAEQHVVS
ncbi:hypothetical protein IAR55_002086 [Kwoniella newhampshirensis]|uniref:Uncharacterized protein n=1 Tax=Kwoniella newhampshirensis TaxID=1651941 RepID=A0AAW0YTL8_9TREE